MVVTEAEAIKRAKLTIESQNEKSVKATDAGDAYKILAEKVKEPTPMKGEMLYQAGRSYFEAAIDLDRNKWEYLYTLKLKDTDPEILAHRVKLREKYDQAAESYMKSAKVFYELKRYSAAIEIAGMAARQYFEVFLLDDVKAKSDKLHERMLKTAVFVSAPYDKVVEAYNLSLRAIDEYGRQLETQNELNKAAFYYGIAGDIYLSLVFVSNHKNLDNTIFSTILFKSDYLSYAAKCYEKAGKLSSIQGLPTIMVGRSIWLHSLRGIDEFFTDKKFQSTLLDETRSEILKRMIDKEQQVSNINSVQKNPDSLKHRSSTFDEKSYNSNVKIDENFFENVLEMVQNICSGMSMQPKTLLKKNESELRDIILFGLNGRYKDQVSSESIQGNGKTDIRVVQTTGSRDRFTGECKMWGGVKILDAGIKQLKGYTPPLLQNAALIIFVKKQNFNKLLYTAEKHIKSEHDNAVFRINEDRHSNGYNLRFRYNNGGFETVITVIFVYLPEYKKKSTKK